MNEQEIAAGIFRKKFYVYGALAGMTAVAWGTSHIALQNYTFHSTCIRKMDHPFTVCGAYKDVSVLNHIQLILFLNGRYLLMEKTNRKKNILKYFFTTTIFTLIEYPFEGLLHRRLLSKHEDTKGSFLSLKGFLYKLAGNFMYDGVYHLTKWLGSKFLGIDGEETKLHNQVLSVFGFQEKSGKIVLNSLEEELENEKEEVRKRLFGIFHKNFAYGLVLALASTLGTVCAHPFRVLTIRNQCRQKEESSDKIFSFHTDGVVSEFIGSSVSRGWFMLGVVPVMLVNICLNSMAKAASMRVDRFKRDITTLALKDYKKKSTSTTNKDHQKNMKEEVDQKERKLSSSSSDDDDDDEESDDDDFDDM